MVRFQSIGKVGFWKWAMIWAQAFVVYLGMTEGPVRICVVWTGMYTHTTHCQETLIPTKWNSQEMYDANSEWVSPTLTRRSRYLAGLLMGVVLYDGRMVYGVQILQIQMVLPILDHNWCCNP